MMLRLLPSLLVLLPLLQSFLLNPSRLRRLPHLPPPPPTLLRLEKVRPQSWEGVVT